MISRTVVATRRAHAVAMASNFHRKPIVAVRRAHGGCNCTVDSWFGVVAVICCNPDFLLQIPKKKGPRIHKGGDHCMGNNAELAEISLENTCEVEQLRWTRMTKYLLRSQFTA